MHKILVVDDEENILKLYQMELRSDGYDVKTVKSSEAALQSVAENRPDLIVLDIKMQDRDGLETLSELKQQNRGLPIILNTAYSTYKDNFQSWLADAYIVKSADLSELKKKIREILHV